MGPFENKTDYTKVDVFPGALPLYIEKRKRVRYESLGNQINKKKRSFISIEKSVFFFFFVCLYGYLQRKKSGLSNTVNDYAWLKLHPGGWILGKLTDRLKVLIYDCPLP